MLYRSSAFERSVFAHECRDATKEANVEVLYRVFKTSVALRILYSVYSLGFVRAYGAYRVPVLVETFTPKRSIVLDLLRSF